MFTQMNEVYVRTKFKFKYIIPYFLVFWSELDLDNESSADAQPPVRSSNQVAPAPTPRGSYR